jgi:hypothetical protein
MRLPVNTVEMLLPVLRRPACSLPSQRWRSGDAAAASASGMEMGVTSALPINPPPVLRAGPGGAAVPCAGAAGVAGGAEGTGGGAEPDFFLKKLNIN